MKNDADASSEILIQKREGGMPFEIKLPRYSGGTEAGGTVPEGL